MARHRTRTVALLVLGLAVLAVSAPLLGMAQPATPPAETAADTELLQRGEAIYADVCIACHQAEGAGVEGIYPALAGNPLVTLPDPRVVTMTILYGRGGMPRFNSIYTDEEIAAVTSYLRAAWGNTAPPVDAASVASLRAEFEATPEATPQSEITGQDPEGDQPGSPESE